MARTERKREFGLNRRAVGNGKPLLFSFVVGFTLLCDRFVEVGASIHEYRNDVFIPKSNAFFFHGGSEGLFASKLHDSSSPNTSDKSLKGKSFIR